MKTNPFTIFFLSIFLLTSCEESIYDPLEGEDVLQAYQEAQVSFIDFMEHAQPYGASMSRMMPMTSFTYETALEENNLERSANIFYTHLSTRLRNLIRSPQVKQRNFILGTTRVMRAFLYQIHIDLFGGVDLDPLVEDAHQSLNGNTSQGFLQSLPADSLYYLTVTYLDQGIDDLRNSESFPEEDIFYGGNVDKWIQLANALKLRAYNNIRLFDPEAKEEINKILQEGNLLESESDDFEYRYELGLLSDRNNPLLFEESYKQRTTLLGPYLSNYFMWLVVGEKAVADPRRAYYFYRQIPDFSQPRSSAVCTTNDPILPNRLPMDRPDHYAAIDLRMPYCIADFAGYYGRDHGNGFDLTSDESSRTLVGLYPYGGKFDDNSFEVGMNNDRISARGKGILPIFQTTYLYFIRAEAALTLGTIDDAASMLEKGIRQSFDKVRSFQSLLDMDFRPDTCANPPCQGVRELITALQAEEDVYVSSVLDQYNLAATEDEKLDIIMKEYLIALWGNGIEAYNNYRRTVKPSNIQPLLEPTGNLQISFLRRSPSFAPKFGRPTFLNQPVFWDTNDAAQFR